MPPFLRFLPVLALIAAPLPAAAADRPPLDPRIGVTVTPGEAGASVTIETDPGLDIDTPLGGARTEGGGQTTTLDLGAPDADLTLLRDRPGIAPGNGGTSPTSPATSARAASPTATTGAGSAGTLPARIVTVRIIDADDLPEGTPAAIEEMINQSRADPAVRTELVRRVAAEPALVAALAAEGHSPASVVALAVEPDDTVTLYVEGDLSEAAQ